MVIQAIKFGWLVDKSIQLPFLLLREENLIFWVIHKITWVTKISSSPIEKKTMKPDKLLKRKAMKQKIAPRNVAPERSCNGNTGNPKKKWNNTKKFHSVYHPYIDRTESNSRQRKRRPEHVTVKFLTTSI